MDYNASKGLNPSWEVTSPGESLLGEMNEGGSSHDLYSRYYPGISLMRLRKTLEQGFFQRNLSRDIFTSSRSIFYPFRDYEDRFSILLIVHENFPKNISQQETPLWKIFVKMSCEKKILTVPSSIEYWVNIGPIMGVDRYWAISCAARGGFFPLLTDTCHLTAANDLRMVSKNLVTC